MNDNYPTLSFDRGVDENLSNLKYHDGHFYQLGSAPMNYADAKAFAESQELYGQKGYLVNINDLAEQDFLYANFFNNDSNQNGLANYTPTEFWLTGMTKNPNGEWDSFSTNEQLESTDYTNWANRDYTNDLTRDTVVVTNFTDYSSEREKGQWIASHSTATTNFNFIIEYDTPTLDYTFQWN